MATAPESTVTVTVLRTNDRGIQVETPTGDQWWNYSKNYAGPTLVAGQRVTLVVQPTAKGDGMWINATAAPADTASSASAPSAPPAAPPASSALAARDILMARMSALKSATALAVAPNRDKPLSSADVLAVAEHFSDWLFRDPDGTDPNI